MKKPKFKTGEEVLYPTAGKGKAVIVDCFNDNNGSFTYYVKARGCLWSVSEAFLKSKPLPKNTEKTAKN